MEPLEETKIGGDVMINVFGFRTLENRHLMLPGMLEYKTCFKRKPERTIVACHQKTAGPNSAETHPFSSS